MAIQRETRDVQQLEPQAKARILHVKVTDGLDGAHPTVNVRLPIGVVRWGMKIGETFSPQLKDANVDWDAVMAMIEHGEMGKIVEVEDEAAHKTVEVWVE
jgi:hypothetical protein